MRSNRRVGVLALAASLALAAATVPAVVPAAADTVKGPVGQLVLTTGAVDAVTYGADTQSLSTTGTCDLASTGKDLLTFKGLQGSTVRKVGFKDDSIGVIETSTTSLCNKVDVISFTSTETLEVKLGADLKFGGQPVAASSATLDVEVRSFLGSKARIQATATLAGNPVPVGTFELQQGSTACNVSDNGNCKWTITPTGLFDTLQLKVLKGSFSLEGGADAGTSPTTFDLVSDVNKVFTCAPGTTLVDGTTTVEYIGSVQAGQCVAFGAKLTVKDTEVQFLKPLDVDPTAQFVVDVDWKLPGAASPSTTLPPAFVDFEVGTPNETELLFCPDYVYKSDGSLGITNLDLLTEDYEPDLKNKQFACISTRSATVSGSEVTISDKIFLIGDAKMRL